jgi:sugar phosphate isomerase/epimerase
MIVLTAGMKRNINCLFLIVAGLVLTGVRSSAADKSKTGLGPSFKGPIGLQLYSLRDQFAKDVPGSLAKVQDFGFTYVELAGTYGNTPEKFKQMLAEHGLKPVASHFAYEKYRDDVESIARDAKALGLEYVGCAWIPHEGAFDEKECRDAIAVFNRAGEALARNGLKFFYHIHGYEFQPHGTGTLFDLMMQETKPDWVSYQMDVVWAVFPGQDPVQLMEKYGKRWTLMHLKDLKKGVKTGELTGHTDVANNVVIGSGQVDWPALLRASEKAGVKYYFIEDESPSVLEQIPPSLRYLEQVKF